MWQPTGNSSFPEVPAILASCKLMSLRDLWTNYLCMFVMDIPSLLQRYQNLLSNDFDAWAYRLLAKTTFLKCSTLPSQFLASNFIRLSCSSWYQAARIIRHRNSLQRGTYSVSSLYAGQWYVFNRIVDPFLLVVTGSTTIDIMSSTPTAPLQLQVTSILTTLSSSTSNTISSLSLHTFSSLPSTLFLLDARSQTGKTFFTISIQDFLQLWNKNIKAIGTSTVAAQLLRGGWLRPIL